MYELPLVFFNVLLQAAVGLVLVPVLLALLLDDKKLAGMNRALRLVGRLAFPVALVALGASFAHLGTPYGAPRALTHLGSSWMSREVLLASLFTAGAAAYLALWQWRPESVQARQMVGLLTAVIGLVTVFASGMIYQLPTRPEWNHWANLASGFVTALLIGAMVTGLAALWLTEASTEAQRILGYIALAAVTMLGISLACYAPYLAGVSTNSAAYLFGNLWFWLRLLVGIGLPLAVAAQMVRGTQPSRCLASLAVVAVLAGELVAHALFYATVMSKLPIF